MKRLIGFEIKKIFMKRIVRLSIVALLFMNGLLAGVDYGSMYAFDGGSGEGTGVTAVNIDKKLAEKYEGILTDAKVQEMLLEFKPERDLGGLNVAYLYQNALQSSVHARFSDANGNWNGRTVSEIFGGEEIKIGYVNGWLHISRYMTQIFLMLSMVIILMAAPVFAGEYGGPDRILLTAKYGRTKCGTAKSLAVCITAFLLTGFISGINVLFGCIFYGTEGLDSSILFAPMDFVENYIPLNLTCTELMTWQILLMFACTAGVLGITLFFSAVCKNPITVLAVSGALFILPLMLPVTETSSLYRVVVLLPVYCVQFVSLMSLGEIRGGLVYGVWSISAGVILLLLGVGLSKYFFARHQA